MRAQKKQQQKVKNSQNDVASPLRKLVSNPLQSQNSFTSTSSRVVHQGSIGQTKLDNLGQTQQGSIGNTQLDNLGQTQQGSIGKTQLDNLGQTQQGNIGRIQQGDIGQARPSGAQQFSVQQGRINREVLLFYISIIHKRVNL